MSLFSSNRRKHSGELDVFEATRYFSGGFDAYTTPFRAAARRDYRVSLDMPLDHVRAPSSVDLMMTNNMEESRVASKSNIKKHQPWSPGRLATIVNSLFHNYSASKKKASPRKEEDESISVRGRRRRLSPTSCYYPSSCTGWSPSALSTHSRNLLPKKREDHHHHHQPKQNNKGHEVRVRIRLGEELVNLKKIINDQSIVKSFREDVVGEDHRRVSAASSDLFELKNYLEFDDHVGLPIYGSADMGVIRRRSGFHM